MLLFQEPRIEAQNPSQAALEALRKEFSESLAAEKRERDEQVASLLALLEESRREAGGSPASGRFQLGGYGEHHYNDLDGRGGAQLDIHRYVLYLGYRFSDSIQLHSEIELEHGFVEDGNGEISIEQLYTDFAVCPGAHVQVGRVLAPLGIVNLRHEPPSFNGVERPGVETVVLPSTWSLDGIGLVAEPVPSIRYQAFLSGSMDGTGFTALQGIRGGRQKERTSFNEPALSGRVDVFPMDSLDLRATAQSLRLGLSGFHGGLDNGNAGVDPGVDADLTIVAVDAEYSIGSLDLRGVGAFEWIEGARELSAVTGETISSEIKGWYLEAAWHWLPEAWKSGERGWADAVSFVRYDDIDTQHEVPGGQTPDPRGARNEWTLGVGLYPLPNLVLKADYQFRDDHTSRNPANQFNLGIGWSF